MSQHLGHFQMKLECSFILSGNWLSLDPQAQKLYFASPLGIKFHRRGGGCSLVFILVCWGNINLEQSVRGPVNDMPVIHVSLGGSMETLYPERKMQLRLSFSVELNWS